MAYDFSKLKTQIKETEEWLARELSGVRTGRATPTLLDSIKPEAYGSRTALRDIASIATEDARTIRVVPWDKELTKAIEKAITDADLGVGVSTDDQGLRVSFPQLTSERRAQLTKIAGDKTEQAKVTLRQHRTDAMKAIDTEEEGGGMGEDEVKRLKGEAQKLIDAGNEALVAVLKRKEEEIAQ
jgi:ribosome recycling factor